MGGEDTNDMGEQSLPYSKFDLVEQVDCEQPIYVKAWYACHEGILDGAIVSNLPMPHGRVQYIPLLEPLTNRQAAFPHESQIPYNP